MFEYLKHNLEWQQSKLLPIKILIKYYKYSMYRVSGIPQGIPGQLRVFLISQIDFFFLAVAPKNLKKFMVIHFYSVFTKMLLSGKGMKKSTIMTSGENK